MKVYQILEDKLNSKSETDRINLCNEAWKMYSSRTTTSVSSVSNVIEGIRHTSQRIGSITLPLLFCQYEHIVNVSFKILTMPDNENFSKDIHFIYKNQNTSSMDLYGYMYKIFKDRNDEDRSGNGN